MQYIVYEMQTSDDGSTSILNYQFDNRNEAESKYHYILSYAAVTQLPVYSAVVMTNRGEIIMSACYGYTPTPEPEPSPEPEPEPSPEPETT